MQECVRLAAAEAAASTAERLLAAERQRCAMLERMLAAAGVAVPPAAQES